MGPLVIHRTPTVVLRGTAMQNLKQRALVLVALVVGPALAMAAPPPTAYDGIVAAVDWTDVITAITAIAALLAAVLVVRKGVRMALGMIR